MKIGMIGAGALGQALARRLAAAGHDIALANSRGAGAVREVAAALGCRPASAQEAAVHGEVVVISVPLRAIAQLPAEQIGARLAIDTCNYYPARDGEIAGLERGGETTTGLLRKALPAARLAKAFNSVLARDLARGGATTASGRPHALPIAADNEAAAAIAAALVRDAGFDPVMTGSIADSWRFERARPAYCRVLDADELAAIVAATRREDFTPEGSWRR